MRAHSGKIVIGLMVGIIFIIGCAQTPLNVNPLTKTEDPSALLEKLGQALAVAKENRVHLLSPNWYAGANASYTNAKMALSKGAALDRVLGQIATGQAKLGQAIEFAGKSRDNLSNVIESRDAAFKAGADRYKKIFVKLEGDFIKLTKAVESDNMGYVRSKNKLVNTQYRALELRAIKDVELVDVRRLMRTAETLNMDDTAPKSYLIAKKKAAEADAAITNDRYDKEAINAAVGAAEFFGRRLHQISAVSQKLDKMEPEDIAVWMEKFLAQTNNQLKQNDRRNLAFKEQQEGILNAINLLQRNKSSVLKQLQAKNLEINKLSKRLTNLEGRTHEVSAHKERLAAEKKFNELYNKVQGYFSTSQAEVYKKSQHLVIRLKAMQFPVGQSFILPANYPLLNTVQRAIKAFGDPDVVIEGHTDSTGAEAMNQQLSRSRAESVQQFLIHNGVLSTRKVIAKGYGSSRPLASNATSKGRAINRRIDVIIKPEKRK
jgi:outer membrane protein OmpA-like peptidoglycan-associated protein